MAKRERSRDIQGTVKETAAPSAEEQAPEVETEPSDAGFPIVGIGASAGGLAAFKVFFSAMPVDTESGIAFLNGALQLLEPAALRAMRLPTDFFFRSPAQIQRERAICIVLSGTGSDGTLGVRAVKGEGVMVMAQNPDSTAYDGMLRSAIATGLVDDELPPAEMPAQHIAYVLLNARRILGEASQTGLILPAIQDPPEGLGNWEQGGAA